MAIPEGSLPVLGPTAEAPSTRSQTSEENVVTINVLNSGYSPKESFAKAGVPVTLKLVSENVSSCSLAFVIPSLGIQQYLERTGVAEINLEPQASGTHINYSCSMGMYGGRIVFD